MFVYIKSQFLLKVGHLGSKTRSLGQILEKPCEQDRDHIFDPIFIKLGQNVCLHKTSVPFESGSSLVKNQVTRSNLKKPCKHSRGHIFDPIFIKLGQNVCLYKIQVPFERRSFRVKIQVTRSNLRKNLLTRQRPHFLPNLHQTWSKCLFT